MLTLADCRFIERGENVLITGATAEGLSRPGELPPPQSLAEPDVNVSAHPAPIIQPFGIYPAFQCTKASGIALAIRSRAFIALLAGGQTACACASTIA